MSFTEQFRRTDEREFRRFQQRVQARRFDKQQTPELFCPCCGRPSEVWVRVNHSSRQGKWDAVCSDKMQQYVQNTEEVNRHELDQFGGAYGLCSIEIRQLDNPPDLAEVAVPTEAEKASFDQQHEQDRFDGGRL